MTGASGIDENGDFALDTGAKFLGKSDLRPSYLRPEYELYPNGITSYIMYNQGYKTELTDSFSGEVVIKRNDSYFNRTAEHFCSHYHTPYDRERLDVGAFIARNVGYIGWEIFTEYAEQGSAHLKYAVIDMIDRLLGEDKTATTTLPSQGIFAITKQKYEGGERLVNHLAYAAPKLRGKGVEIIEDLPPVINTAVLIKTDKKPARVYLAPSMDNLDFTYENGRVGYTVPKFECSTLAIIEF
jgi:hypothetical protein